MRDGGIVGQMMPTHCIKILSEGEKLLQINPDGSVTAPTLEAASEAGKVFVSAILAQIAGMLADGLKTP